MAPRLLSCSILDLALNKARGLERDSSISKKEKYRAREDNRI